MAKADPRTLRDLRLAAVEGNRTAIRALLRRDNKEELAKEVRDDKPLSPRVKRMVRALTAGPGTRDKLGEWEHLEADGTITNDLQNDDAPTRPWKSKEE